MELAHFGFVVGQVVDGDVIDFRDYVAAGEVHVFGEAGRLHFGDDHAGDFGHAELARKIRLQFFNVQTELSRQFRLVGLILRCLRYLREDLRAVGDDERDVFRLFVAHVTHLHRLSDHGFRDGIYQVGAGMHGLAVDVGDDVAGLQAGLIRGAARLDGFDDDAVRDAEFLQQHGIIAAIFLERDADRAARDLPVGDELIVNADHRRRRQREAHTFESAAPCVNGGVDADHFAGHVDERPAGITGINCGVRLNETLKLVADVGAIFGADDSGSHRGIQAEGAADGQNPIANLYAVGIAEFRDREFAVGFNFDYGEVGVLVKANHPGVVFGGIAIERHLNFGGLINYVIVGKDETFFVHDYAGAQAALGVRAIVGRVKETVEEILEGVAEFFGR